MEKSRKKMALFSQWVPTFIGAPSFFEGYGIQMIFLFSAVVVSLSYVQLSVPVCVHSVPAGSDALTSPVLSKYPKNQPLNSHIHARFRKGPGRGPRRLLPCNHGGDGEK